MRVIHVIKAVGIAGAEQHLLTLLPGLRSHDVDARLILLFDPRRPMSDYVTAMAAKGVPVEPLPIRHHADATVLTRLARCFRDEKPDAVHTHLIHADLYGIVAAWLSGVRAIVTSRHNDDAFRYRRPVRMINAVLWRGVQAGIGISEAITRFSITVEGAPAERMHTIHYGVDVSQPPLDRGAARRALLQELRLPDSARLAGMACRLVEQKGVSYAIDAFGQVAAEFPDAYLLIAGEGRLRAALESQAREAQLAERIRFLGWRGNIPAYMAALDVLLAPSLWEGFGLVLLEAMAQQTPIIASAVSAIPEIVIDGETGRLVPGKDATALADALRGLLADAAYRQHLGLVGRDRLEMAFNADTMVRRTLDVYQSLCGNL
jgi:glycosyltransferase involved in cell wall biosynthesis